VGGFERRAFDFGNHAAETESTTRACQSAREYAVGLRRREESLNPLH
jgi:hypothetical protein